jgi:hypothetical protein
MIGLLGCSRFDVAALFGFPRCDRVPWYLGKEPAVTPRYCYDRSVTAIAASVTSRHRLRQAYALNAGFL